MHVEPTEVERVVALIVADLTATLDMGPAAAEVMARSEVLTVAEVLAEWDHDGPSRPRLLYNSMENVQQAVLDDRTDPTWPSCPDHGNHPLWLTRPDDPVWTCTTSGRVFCPVGSLHSIVWTPAGVLDHGVPPVPAALLAGMEVPVACWRDDDVGAVLSIHHDPDDEEEPYSQDIEILQRGPDGVWIPGGPGGTDWPVMTWGRPDVPLPVLTGCAASCPIPGGYLRVASGIAPPGVERVRVVQDDSDEIVDVEPVTGAFLVRVDDHPYGDIDIISL